MSETFEVEIEGMGQGGLGVGRRGRRTASVPYTIPGERVLARALRSDERSVTAEGVRLLDASADRVLPRCPHFGPGRCWRCQWQHIDISAQRLIKQDVLAEHLERFGGIKDNVVQSVIAAPDDWHYNTHMTFTPVSGGRLGLPSFDERTIAIETCHVLHPDLLDLYENLDLEMPGLRRVKLQIGSDGARMIILYMPDENAPELETDLDASINLLLPDNEPVNLVGESHVRYRVHDRMLRVTAGSYFRANAALVPQLVDQVLKLLAPGPNDYVLDLFAGVGVFSAFLARRAKLVTAIESYPPAATDAEVNLADFDNVDVIEGTVEEALSELDGEYDLAVVDPSASLSDVVIEQVRQMGVQRLVYVSGDSATLARDAKRLAKQGYRLMTAQPFDFAPQTYHIETAALFVHRT